LYRFNGRKPFFVAQLFWGICIVLTLMQTLFSPQCAEDSLVLYLYIATVAIVIVFGYDILFSFFREHYRGWKRGRQTDVKQVSLLSVYLDATFKTPAGNFIVGILILSITVLSDSISTVFFNIKGNASLAGTFIFASIVLYVLARRYGDLTDEAVRTKTALEETVKKLEVQTARAQEASQSKSTFLASMSHEIRTPMNAIIGMSELIRTDNFDEMQKTYFADIRKMAHSLLGIINDILDISKIEAGKMELAPSHFDLVEIFDSLCSQHRFTATAKSLLFKSSIADDLPRVVYADEIRIRQIVNNLVSNAVKYTKKGFVSVDFSRDHDTLVITVADSGIGIKEEDIPKLFDTFERFDAQKNRGIVGTGLGLAIVQNIVVLMKGSVEVDSEYGVGSTFTVRLPLVEGNEIEREANFPPIFADATVRVLVVDDNPINLTVAIGFLKKHHIQPDTAAGGAEAIDKVKAAGYDLVFMDHMMPGMDGTEVSRVIRSLPGERFKTVPIVALSAHVVAGARDLFLESGMNDFLAKPINAAELNRMLRRWLPQDKIVNTEETEDMEDKIANTEETVDDALSLLFAELRTIAELDVPAGLSHIGENRPAYIDILRQFCAETDGYLEEIRRFKDYENWKEYSIRLHAMKGVFANIGVVSKNSEAPSLKEWAHRLEMASKDGDTATCAAETDAIVAAISQFRDKLLATSLMPEDAPKEKHQATAKFISERLSALIEACVSGDSDNADAIAAELETVHVDDETDEILKEIVRAAAALEYETVRDIYRKQFRPRRIRQFEDKLQGTEERLRRLEQMLQGLGRG
jgi:signal transduction histidine kinase/DNA-binding NarL/FixJ family response regulator